MEAHLHHREGKGLCGFQVHSPNVAPPPRDERCCSLQRGLCIVQAVLLAHVAVREPAQSQRLRPLPRCCCMHCHVERGFWLSVQAALLAHVGVSNPAQPQRLETRPVTTVLSGASVHRSIQRGTLSSVTFCIRHRGCCGWHACIYHAESAAMLMAPEGLQGLKGGTWQRGLGPALQL